MRFEKAAEMFERLEKVSSRLEMTAILAEMFSEAKAEDVDKIVYLSQARLGPDYNTREIGLGDKMVQEAIAKASGFPREEVEKLYREKGDLGLVAEHCLAKKRQRSLFSESLSVSKVFENLKRIAGLEGKGSQELKLKLLAELFNSSTPLEAKFIARIPIGNLRLGTGEPTLMDAFAITFIPEIKKDKKLLMRFEKELKEKKEEKRAEELDRKIKFFVREKIEEKFNVHPDIGNIAKVLKEHGLAGLDKIKITPGIPIRPTLAERLPSAEEIVKKLGRCAIEAKYDGFRFQIHKSGAGVTIFSRNQENMTHMFPEIVEAVKKQVKAKDAIFEGEALAYNEETGEYLPFQVTIQRKRKYGVEEKAKEFPLRLFAFDVMMVDGKNAMELPFIERRKKLASIIAKGGTIELTQSIETDDAKKIEAFFNLCVEKGLEGIIAKDLHARYIAGARKFAWIKLKRSYRGELTDSIDAVIIGYYKGKGKRTQFGLGALLSAVYNNKDDCFESIAKIGTGMTEEQLVELEKMLSKLRESKKPARVKSELEPDVWVSPKIVIELVADEITQSPVHECAKKETGEGLALRFPRLISIRRDKKPEEATTTKEITGLFGQQKHVQLDEGAG